MKQQQKGLADPVKWNFGKFLLDEKRNPDRYFFSKGHYP